MRCRPFWQNKNKIEYKRGLLLYLNAENLLKAIQVRFSRATSIFPALVRISGAESIEAFDTGSTWTKKDSAKQALCPSPERQVVEDVHGSAAAPSAIVVTGTGYESFRGGRYLADFGRMWNEANQQLPKILNTEQMDRWNKISNS
jgi:hypothetical protein